MTSTTSPTVTRVFRVTMLIAALHVIGGTFVLLHPGSRRVDHLSGGLVPVAAAALAAWAYPRLRPLAQGALLLSAGAVASTAGGLTLSGVVAQGLGGDDLTGLLLLAAGAVTSITGVIHLWCTRDRAGPWWRASGRRIGWSLAALAVVALVVFPLGSAIVAVGMPARAPGPVDLGHPHRSVSIRAHDGVVLAGRYVPSRNGAAVLLQPGDITEHARMLVAHGYGVLLLDPRGEGASEGDPNSLGWQAAADAAAAVDFLASQPGVRDGAIGGLGLSVGGETLLQAAAEGAALTAVVSEGAGIRSVRESLVSFEPRDVLEVPVWFGTTVATGVLSGELPPPALQHLMADLRDRPVLLIHAGAPIGGEELNPAYQQAAGGSAERWLIAEAGHTGGLRTLPDEYERRVIGFLDAALLTGRVSGHRQVRSDSGPISR